MVGFLNIVDQIRLQFFFFLALGCTLQDVVECRGVSKEEGRGVSYICGI